jgi:uncharacterized membrane protein YdjX (TVP38/TMEM64 family)
MKIKIAFISLVALFIFIFFYFGLHQYANLDTLKAQQTTITEFNNTEPLTAALIFFTVYIVITGLSLPGAAIMTLAGGAVFGLLKGILLVSFASTIGATLAFLISRYLFREALQNKFAERLHIINQGIEKDGAFYLFTLRLVPVFPFFIVNLVMGLTPIKTLTFFLVSQLGMLAGTIVYVFAGTQLAQINNLKDIFSVELILSFTLLGLFPLIAKKTIDFIQSRRQLENNEIENESS